MSSVNDNNASVGASNDDDDEFEEGVLHDSVTKQSFATMIDSAMSGVDILKIKDLPNSSQR